MKVGVLNAPFSAQSLRETVTYLKNKGVQTIEIGCGGFPGKAQCNPKELLADDAKLQEFCDIIAKARLEISALSCHANHVHPNAEIAKQADEDFRDAVLLAEKIGVKTVITFSGCPGDGPNAQKPNWVTCPWPEDFTDVLDYQWNEVLIPYWKKTAAFAKEHGVNVAFEMHPGFCVYNTETMLRIRKECGDNIGANFDPSHLFWQGIDPVASIRALGKAIFHVHAKDCRIDDINTKVNGVLDTKHYGDEINRSWVFRTIGYGHNTEIWNAMISELQLIGYEGAVSIEHEDSYMSTEEGLDKAINFLKSVIIQDNKPTSMFWA